MDKDTFIIIVLGLILLLYIYNDFLIPFIKKFYKSFINTTDSSNFLESFAQNNEISKNANAISTFDTNWYLREPNQAIFHFLL